MYKMKAELRGTHTIRMLILIIKTHSVNNKILKQKIIYLVK